MSVNSEKELLEHFGHEVVVEVYGDIKDPINVSIECLDCCEVLIDGETHFELVDLEQAWLQAEELSQDFETLNHEELINCRNDMTERINIIMESLSEHVSDDMSKKEAV